MTIKTVYVVVVKYTGEDEKVIDNLFSFLPKHAEKVIEMDSFVYEGDTKGIEIECPSLELAKELEPLLEEHIRVNGGTVINNEQSSST